jgi:DNA polymerase III delta prime subunit
MIIGHSEILADLKKLADDDQLNHGYVFFGPAMVGKKRAAETLATYLEHGAPVLSDMMLIEPGENGSIGIDAVREIRNFLWQKPNVSARRTLIIDGAEMMTTEAQNALLKITEEPPASSLLILSTSDADSILPTILSRLPKIYFGTVAEEEIEAWLKDEAVRESGKVNAAEATATTAKGKTKTKAANPAASVDMKEVARRAMGKPGLAWRLLHDKNFQEQIELAEKLLKTPAASRRDLIKKIIEPDEFNFRKFLDAVILVLAWHRMDSDTSKSSGVLWHKALALYDRETNFSLNPRLQLEALLM